MKKAGMKTIFGLILSAIFLVTILTGGVYAIPPSPDNPCWEAGNCPPDPDMPATEKSIQPIPPPCPPGVFCAPSLPNTSIGTTGTHKLIVIPVYFNDTSNTTSLSSLNATLQNITDYYAEVSYGKLNLIVDVAPRWYLMPLNMSDYGADYCYSTSSDYYYKITGTYNNTPCASGYTWLRDRFEYDGTLYYGVPILFYDAINASDADITFSNYDHIMVVHAGEDEASGSNFEDIWSVRWSGLNIPTNDGAIVDGSFTVSEFSPIGAYTHEFGHDLGLPDLYDTDYTSWGIGDWGLMGGGSWNGDPSGSSPAHFSAWSKYFLGWVNPIQVTSTLISQPIHAVETTGEVYMLLDNPGDSPGNLDWNENGGGTGEYFLVENRYKTGYDAYLPGEGLLIWHIDETRPNNTDENHYLVDLEEAHGMIQDLQAKTTNNQG